MAQRSKTHFATYTVCYQTRLQELEKADMYSLGVFTNEILYIKRPFPIHTVGDDHNHTILYRKTFEGRMFGEHICEGLARNNISYRK